MWKKDSEIKKICWVRYSEKSCKWILYTKEGEDEDVPAKCVFAFDSYPVATQFVGTRGEAVDTNILYAITEFVECGYVFIGVFNKSCYLPIDRKEE